MHRYLCIFIIAVSFISTSASARWNKDVRGGTPIIYSVDQDGISTLIVLCNGRLLLESSMSEVREKYPVDATNNIYFDKKPIKVKGQTKDGRTIYFGDTDLINKMKKGNFMSIPDGDGNHYGYSLRGFTATFNRTC